MTITDQVRERVSSQIRKYIAGRLIPMVTMKEAVSTEIHKSERRYLWFGMSRMLGISSVAFITWLMVIIAFMLINRTFDLEVFFALALIGLLVVVILIDTSSVQPRYLRRMKYMLATGLIAFGFIIAHRIVEILPR